MANSTWPPSIGLGTPTVPRQDVILPLHYSITIEAPASLVWQILLNTSGYPSWNSFVPRVVIHSQPDGSSSPVLQPGTSFTFYVIMDPAKPQKESPTQLRVVDISTPEKPSEYIPEDVLREDPLYFEDLSKVYRISWKTDGGFVSRGLRSERFHEIIVLGENRCEVRNWECMGGILSRTVKWMFGDTLSLRFKEWCEDLKKESEKQTARLAA